MDKNKNVVINLSGANKTPAFPKVSLNKSGGWVNYGPKNLFPQEVIAYNSRSPVNTAIIESTVTYICGKGVRESANNADKYVSRPNSGESWDDIIEPIAKDYKTFGGFGFQVIVNKDETTVSLFHQDFSTVRIGEIDDAGAPLSWRISNDWTKTSGQNKPIEVDTWPGSVEAATPGKAYLFVHWDYSPGLPRYCVPSYFAAIEYIKADGLLGEFYNNTIDNGFTPSVVIAMPSNPSDPHKDEFQKNLEDSFAGAKGASQIIVLWGESGTNMPTLTPFQSSGNADIYNNVEGIIFQKIISAHRLSSPTLAGVSGSGNLSGNAAEIIDAYVLYNYTVVEKMRRRILDKLNVFTAINKLPELAIEELDVLPKIRATEAPENADTPAEEPATLSKPSKLKRFLKALALWK